MGNGCSCAASPCCDSGAKGLNLPNKEENESDLRPRPNTEVDFTDLDVLAISEWNWEVSRNGADHHTSEYDHMSDWSGITGPDNVLIRSQETKALVVRRGHPFFIAITTNTPYDVTKHKISLVFLLCGAKTSFSSGAEVGVLLGAKASVDGWRAEIESQDGKSLHLKISTPASAIVGKWRLEIDIDSSGKSYSFSSSTCFYLLFNAWCKDDTVYLKNEEERNEYVLADTGLIWRGTHSRLRPCAWQYGQFEKNILECVFYMLANVCHVLPSNWANPIVIARAISAGTNSPNDDGILVGRWSDDFSGGRAPGEWRDSVAILEQFYTKKKSVKYGQCWVFSAIVTTIARALGIPARPVTNYLSAHDTHNSLTIDCFFDEDLKPMKNLNSDSIWNFHVWNEVWMARPDLGKEYNGWQVIDATPQEQSDGQFRCGPTSVAAIKKGEVHRPYDAQFVYAEVNADKLYWKYQGKREPMKLLGRKTGGVGLNISTKAVGKMRRDDITYLYKHPEKSKEREAVMRDALRRCESTFARYYLNEKFEDVEFNLQLKDDVTIGQPFKVVLNMKNKSNKEHKVAASLRVDTMLYTGTAKHQVKKNTSHLILKPESEKTSELEVTFEDYYNKLVDQCSFNISCLGKVEETGFEYLAQDDFRVRKPDIEIECTSGKLEEGKKSEWRASFENPLPKKLTKGKFYLRTKKQEPIFTKLKKPVEIGEKATFEFALTPKSSGEFTVTVVFTSKELSDVDGFFTRTVSPDIQNGNDKLETEKSAE